MKEIFERLITSYPSVNKSAKLGCKIPDVLKICHIRAAKFQK
jgi:hypothetical protein